MGYTNVRHYHGGMADWKEAGLPIESAPAIGERSLPAEPQSSPPSMPVETRRTRFQQPTLSRSRQWGNALFDLIESLSPARIFFVWLGMIVGPAFGDYPTAFRFGRLGFELVEDSASLTNDGRPKRWVVVRPPGAATGVLLARADGADQASVIGRQAAGRVAFFLHVDDFDAAYTRMASAGVQFVTAPRTEPYGRVAVFVDIAGNKWDLTG